MHYILAILLSFVAYSTHAQNLSETSQSKVDQSVSKSDQPKCSKKNGEEISRNPGACSQALVCGSQSTEPKPNDKQSNEDTTEFWPPIYGYRLKVTDTLLVVFTGLLFTATYYLYKATRALVAGAEDTAERQLRAYIYSTHTEPLQTTADGGLGAVITYKNYGQTPASNVQCFATIGLCPLPLVDDDDLPNYVEASTAPLAPGETINQFPTFPRPLSEAEIIGIRTNKLAICISGEVSYVDIFKKKRRTKFRLFNTGADYHSKELAYHSVGNDAD